MQGIINYYKIKKFSYVYDIVKVCSIYHYDYLGLCVCVCVSIN
jgi:hypothetical protein